MKVFNFLTVLCVLVLAGCASYTDLPPGMVKKVESLSPVVERKVVTVSVPEVSEVPEREYRVGFGDILFINVSGRPELGSPVVAGGSKAVEGSRVDGAGNLHLPMVGAVQVAGLTMAEVQKKLEERFSRYLNDPWVVAEIVVYGSRPVYLLGQFRQPGTHYLDRPTNLLQGLSLGGGLTDIANLRSARLIRDGETWPVDLRQLVERGEMDQNVWLHPGDTIFVPDDRNLNVFVFGAVDKPGSVPMPNGNLTLMQALANAGMDGAGDNENYIRIIRSLSATRGELLVVDMQQILHGNALPFPLMEGDIVYVPRNAIGNWNQAIEEILPSLQAISAILQPFVQIEVLKRD